MIKEDLNQVWVLSWRYGDGSGSGVLRVYLTEDRARLDLELIESEGTGKSYELELLPVYP
jgi:hypothetical protein